MFTQHRRLHPARGKVRDLRALVADSVRRQQEKGARVALRERILSDEGPTLVVSQRFDSLVEMEAARRERAADPAFQAYLGEVGALLDRPILITLEEVLVPMAAVPSTVGYVTRAWFPPIVGRGGRLREVLEQTTREAHAAGYGGRSLNATVAASTGGALTLTSVFEDAGALDAWYRDRAAARLALSERVSELIRAPIAVRWFEVVVPYR